MRLTNARPCAVNKTLRWFLLALIVVALAACSDDGEPAGGETPVMPTRTLIPPSATPKPTAIQTPLTPTPTDLPSAAALVPAGEDIGAEPFTPQAIIARAMDRLIDTHGDITAGEVRLMSLDAFDWPDDAWGCESVESGADREPIDDPAVVPGFRVVLYASNRAYVYHTDEYGEMFACADRAWLDLEGEPVPVEPIAEAMIELSRRDAARRFDVDTDDLALVSLVTVTWPDAAIGCPKPGGEYDDRETPGYRVVFAVDAAASEDADATDATAERKRMIYHTSVKDVIYCTRDEEILPAVLRRALPERADGDNQDG